MKLVYWILYYRVVYRILYYRVVYRILYYRVVYWILYYRVVYNGTKAMQLEIAETSVGAGHKFPK